MRLAVHRIDAAQILVPKMNQKPETKRIVYP